MSELADILSEANERHRATLHPRWANVVEWASARLENSDPRAILGAGGKQSDVAGWVALEKLGDPLDVPRLFAAFVRNVKSSVAAHRIVTLARRPDARIVSGILRLLGAPPYRAGTALPFFRACVTALVTSKDPRAAEGLADLSKRYKTIVETSVGEQIAELCARGAKQLGTVSIGALTSEDERRLAELEQVFDAEKRGHEGRRADTATQAKSEAELLEAIYAAPDDDGPRLVLADFLQERGEERGEFISLQVRRAAGQGTFESLSREQALLAETKRAMAFGLPLSAGGTCTFHRGLPSSVFLSRTGTKPVTGLPAWRTVTGLGLPNGASGTALRGLLDHQCMERVVHVSQITSEHRKALGAGARRWTGVGLTIQQDEVVAPIHDTYPNLTALLLVTAAPIGARLLDGLQELESLTLSARQGLPAGDWLSGFPKLRTLVVTSNETAWQTQRALSSVPLRELRLSYVTSAAPFEGLSFERLDVGRAPFELLEAIVRALAHVGELFTSLDQKIDVGRLLKTCEGKVQRIRALPQVTLKWANGAWSVDADYLPSNLALLVRLAPFTASLTVAPCHHHPLALPAPFPTADERKRLTDAWGARLTIVERNPRVLAASLEPRTAFDR